MSGDHVARDARPADRRAASSDAGDKGLFFQLFDASPFPAVVTRLSRPHRPGHQPADLATSSASPRTRPIGRHAPDYYVNPDERRRMAEQVAREGRAEDFRFELRRPGWRHVLGHRPRRGASRSRGEPAILAVFKDITERSRGRTRCSRPAKSGWRRRATRSRR